MLIKLSSVLNEIEDGKIEGNTGRAMADDGGGRSANEDDENDYETTNLRHSTFQQHSDRLGKSSSSFLDITEVTPELLLCGAVALRGNVLEDLRVTCVINATRELPDTPIPDSLQNEILYLRVNVDDKTDCDIYPWLDIVADIIHQVKSTGGKTLIHCVAGVSRSATLCLAYLIKYQGYSLHDSYVMVKSLRPIIRPNSGFFSQLIEFEKRTTGEQTVVMVQSNYTNSCVPHLYEEEYQRFYNMKHRRRQ